MSNRVQCLTKKKGMFRVLSMHTEVYREFRVVFTYVTERLRCILPKVRQVQPPQMWTHSNAGVYRGRTRWRNGSSSSCVGRCLMMLQLWHTVIVALSKPVGMDRRNDAKFRDYDDEVLNYLMRFGYLEKSNIETGNLRTIDELQKALRNLQAYGGLNPSGTVDEQTLMLMRTPRCGAPDQTDSLDFLPSNDERLHGRIRRYIIQGQKWQTPIVTWSLVNQTMSELDGGQVRRVLHEALDLWSQHGNINFREVYSSEADIQVLFARKFHGDGYNFDGPGKVLAHAFYPGTGIGGDAHFDADETWLLNEPPDADGTRLFDVAVHEFGHSLGLGHSSQQDAIMFPWHHISYRGKDTIPEDDRLGIQSIYGARKKIYGKNPERHTPSTTTTTTTTTPAPPPRPTTRSYYPVKNTTGHPWEGLHPHDRPHTPRTTATTTRTNHRIENGHHPVFHYPTTDRPGTTTRHRQHHRPHHRTTTTTTTTVTTTTSATRRPYYHRPTANHPNPCNTSFDAITLIRNELFIFKDRWLWRLNENDLHRPSPFEIHRMFFGLPQDFVRIDTVYENKHQKIIFFIGKQYYVFNSQYLEPGYPKPLTDLGLPDSIEKIDAALVWSHNNRTYLYSGRLYWRFDEDTNRVELDYPRDMSMWKGIGYNIDAAFQYRDGKTYFFKGLGYWRFNDMRMSIAHEQKSSATRWMKCRLERQVLNDLDVDEDAPSTTPTLLWTTGNGTNRAASSRSNDRRLLLLLSLPLLTLALSFLPSHNA